MFRYLKQTGEQKRSYLWGLYQWEGGEGGERVSEGAYGTNIVYT
jgi:hypothetical protein